MKTNKELHIISVSGGKDSAALAIYLKKKYPKKKFYYIFLDTGEELPETYIYLEKIKKILGIKIDYLKSEKSFQDWLEEHHDYLPSPMERWCTRRMKIDKFLDFIKSHKKLFITMLVYEVMKIEKDWCQLKIILLQ